MMLITMMMTVTMMIIDQVVYQEAKGIGDKGVDYEEIIDHDDGDDDDDDNNTDKDDQCPDPGKRPLSLASHSSKTGGSKFRRSVLFHFHHPSPEDRRDLHERG